MKVRADASRGPTPSKPLLVSHTNASLAHPVYTMALEQLAASGRCLHLDIGAGTGENVAYTASFGLQTVALEYDADYARYIPGTVVRGSSVSLPFPSGTYDVVTLIHVLEHVPQYMDTLKEIRRVLRPRGYLILEVPNKWTLQELLNRLYCRLILKGQNRHLGHCNWFTHKRLRRHLNDTGFTIIDHKVWGGPLRGTVSSLIGLALSILFKGLIHHRRCDLQDNERIRVIQRRLSSVYDVLSRVDRAIARRSYRLIEVVGFVCEAI